MGLIASARGLLAASRPAPHVLQRQEPRLAIRNEIVTGLTIEELAARMNIGASSIAGAVVTPETASRLSVVASCERVICETFAQVPWPLYRRLEGDDREKATDHPLYRLLHDSPQEGMTSLQWRMVAGGDLFYRGRFYAHVLRSPVDGMPLWLMRLHPDATRKLKDPRSGRAYFEHRREDGSVVIFQPDEILHVWMYSRDGWDGISPIQRHREAIGDGITMREHGSRSFANGAKLSGVIEAEGTIPPESKKDLRDDWKKMTSGDASYSTPVLDRGMKFSAVSMTNEDAQYIESRKLNRSEICGIWGVPPHKIGDLDRATFSNIEHQEIGFVVGTMLPVFCAFDQAVSLFVLRSDPKLYSEFLVDGLLRGDFKTRQEGLQLMRQNGAINANEWRRLMNMNRRKDPGGEEYIVAANMAPQNKPPSASQTGN